MCPHTCPQLFLISIVSACILARLFCILHSFMCPRIPASTSLLHLNLALALQVFAYLLASLVTTLFFRARLHTCSHSKILTCISVRFTLHILFSTYALAYFLAFCSPLHSNFAHAQQALAYLLACTIPTILLQACLHACSHSKI